MARAPAAAAAAAAAAVLLAAAAAAANRLPSEFKFCKKSGPNFDACLLDAISSAIKTLAPGSPELNTPPLDPLAIPKVVIPGNKNAPVNINLEFSNIVVHGIKDLHLTELQSDVDNYKLSAKGGVNKLTLESDYVMDGRILLIPATGSGRLDFDITNMTALIHMAGEAKTKKDNTYMKVKDFDFKFGDLGHLAVKFENLFNGDKTLGNAINTLLNENWRDLWAELRSPFEQVLEPTFREYAKRAFDRAPYNEIYLP